MFDILSVRKGVLFYSLRIIAILLDTIFIKSYFSNIDGDLNHASGALEMLLKSYGLLTLFPIQPRL